MKRCILLVWCGVLAASCGGGNAIVKDGGAPDLPGEVVMDVVAEVSIEYDSRETVDYILHVDATADAPEALTPQCDPGEGCFLDPCSENEECQSGWCVHHLGEGVCAQTCQAECPAGWSCQQVAGTVPDVVYICVSDYANLCRPCSQSADCVSVGGAADACVAYGPDGSFCGGPCANDGDCPWGFSCLSTVTVDGIDTLQCVADAGECPCTGNSVAQALWTPCYSTNQAGTCIGQRICTEEGLTDCDAALPAGETCNGIDDDCDDEIDEPDLVEGEYQALCDDSNECTDDGCLGEEGCVNENLDEGACDDHNPCTLADHCVAGTCAGNPVDCDDDNPCTDDACDDNGECVSTPNQKGCDDDNPCTLADHCKEGFCTGMPVSCDCQEDSDCEALEDGDLCNGTLVCNLSKFPYLCAVDEATVVGCPDPEGVGSECLVAVCDPASGQCAELPGADGKACSDGDACTFAEQCAAGSCAGGLTVNCNDGNLCTDDSCESDSGCVNEFNSVPCDDDNWCTVGDLCADGLCVAGGEFLDCDNGDPCFHDNCEPATGCYQVAVNCEDESPCTLDTCHAQTGCVHTAVTISCDPCFHSVCNGFNGEVFCLPLNCNDFDACTVDDCPLELGTCQHAIVICDDQNPCTDDSCNALTGCQYVANFAPCDDGNACTAGDLCGGGACSGGKEVNCNDGNLCTDDSCAPLTGCANTPNAGPCSDGSVCTVGDICQGGDCAPGEGELDCNDDNPCTDEACWPTEGCGYVANDAACDDGNACTVSDLCDGGQCKGGEMLDCDDESPCTKDGCLAEGGCFHLPQDGLCSDDDVCTLDEVCLQGLCTSILSLDCDDGNPCTEDSCDPQDGCLQVPTDGACDDGDACTDIDACEGGECVGTGAVDCDDLNLCTDDTCDSQLGCQNADNAEACDDGDACTETDVCQGGACVGGDALDCDDENDCTDDSCDADLGCQHVNTEGVCDDGNACTATDTCQAGECIGTDEADCDDGNKCTVDTCDADGCVHTYSGACSVQPGPAEGKDHYIGSYYNSDPNGTDTHIRTGGWGDKYWILLEFPIDSLPAVAEKATIRLFGMNDNNNPTSMYFDRNTSAWAENCTWGQRPSYTNLKSIPPSSVGVWYEIDVTDLYNGWRAGSYPNYGVQLRSHGTSNNYNGFWSSDYTADASLRPMLVVESAE